MARLTLGDVAKRAGLRPSAMRCNEDVGMLPPAERVSGERRYAQSVLARLAVFRLAQDVAFSVAEIQALVDRFDTPGIASARWQVMARQEMTDVAALLQRAGRMKRLLEASMDCGCLPLGTRQLVLQRNNSETDEQSFLHQVR